MNIRRKMQGITLMELMIVVLIMGILASIAYPNYREFAARAKRNEAKSALLMAATNQEKFYLQNQVFSDDLVPLGFSGSPFTTETGSYIIDVDAPLATRASNFLVTATFQLGGSESLKCATFTIDGRGVKTSAPDGNCWTRTR